MRLESSFNIGRYEKSPSNSDRGYLFSLGDLGDIVRAVEDEAIAMAEAQSRFEAKKPK